MSRLTLYDSRCVPRCNGNKMTRFVNFISQCLDFCLFQVGANPAAMPAAPAYVPPEIDDSRHRRGGGRQRKGRGRGRGEMRGRGKRGKTKGKAKGRRRR